MKKNKKYPQFHHLTLPAKKPVRDFISLLIFYFFAVSAGGYLWEVLIFLIRDRRFCNRGFLYGPWLPVYGSGAVLFYCLLYQTKKHPASAFLFSMLIGTGLELAIGWFLDIVWGLRYWDYSDSFLNFRGYICIWSALGFGIAGTLWICHISGILRKFWFCLSDGIRRGFNTLLFLLFLLDCTAALILPNIGTGITF